MNLNGDENRIRQLFREMSRDDDRLAPEFAEVIVAATSTQGCSRLGTRTLALVWMAAVVFIAMVIAVIFAVRPPRSQSLADPGSQVAESPPRIESEPTSAVSRPPVDASSTAYRQTIPKRVR